MKKQYKTLSLVTLVSALSMNSASAVTIEFDYTYDTNNFFTAERRVLLETAAEYYSNFKDNLTKIENTGANSWTANFYNPSNPSEPIEIANLVIPENTVRVYVGATNIQSGALGVGGSGGFGASGGAGFNAFIDNLRNRGQGNTQGANANDYSLWGGSMYFNTSVNWNDSLAEPEFAQYDLYSVILHELGHVFGIGTADSWYSQINDNNQFAGANAVAANGGAVNLNAEGDHWANGTMSTVNGVAQEAALDPDAYNGQRKLLTDLDTAAFKDIGWEIEEVAEVPLPGALGLYLLGMAGIAARKLKK